MKQQKVNKALSPEEATIVSNIQSLLAQLTQGSAGEQAAAMSADDDADDLMKAAPMGEGDEEDVKMGAAPVDEDESVEKAVLETTQSDGVVAGDDAEASFDEALPDESSANAKAVAKAIMDMIQPPTRSVAKSSQVNTMIAALTQVVSKSISRQNELENTLTKVLEGLGVAKQLELRTESERANRKPIVDNGNAAVVKALTAILTQSQPATQTSTVHKSMHEQARDNLGNASVLAAMIGAK